MKQREFEEQVKKMKEMEEEFAVMLSDTQNKMAERVEGTMHLADEVPRFRIMLSVPAV